MKIIFLLAAVSLATAVPKPGIRFRSLYKPAAVPQKALRPRIIGGSEAVPHSRPYQAFLEVHDDNGTSWYCGGEVISNNYILTAGHCGDGGTWGLATLGAHDIYNFDEPGQTTELISDIFVHPDWDKYALTNDISAFLMYAPMKFNEYVQPVALPSRSDAANTFVGENATVGGWGLTESGGGGDLSPVLKVLDSPIVPNSQCENESHWTIPDTQICISGAAETGSCNGDSGGPLTVKINGVDTVVGIVSYGVRGCLPGYSSVFTRVTSYLDFIASATDAVVN